MTTQELQRKGFDLAKKIPGEGRWVITCSACSPMVINNVPCHEHGCPNSKTNPHAYAETNN